MWPNAAAMLAASSAWSTTGSPRGPAGARPPPRARDGARARERRSSRATSRTRVAAAARAAGAAARPRARAAAAHAVDGDRPRRLDARAAGSARRRAMRRRRGRATPSRTGGAAPRHALRGGCATGGGALAGQLPSPTRCPTARWRTTRSGVGSATSREAGDGWSRRGKFRREQSKRRQRIGRERRGCMRRDEPTSPRRLRASPLLDEASPRRGRGAERSSRRPARPTALGRRAGPMRPRR